MRARTLRIARAAQRAFDAAEPGIRAALVAYAHGAAFVEDQDRIERICCPVCGRPEPIGAPCAPYCGASR